MVITCAAEFSHQHRISTQLLRGEWRSIKSDKESGPIIGQGLNSTMRRFTLWSYPGCRCEPHHLLPWGRFQPDFSKFQINLLRDSDLRRRDGTYRIGTVSWFSLVVKQPSTLQSHCLKLVKILGTQVADLDRAEPWQNKRQVATRTNGDKWRRSGWEACVGFRFLFVHRCTFGGRAMEIVEKMKMTFVATYVAVKAVRLTVTIAIIGRECEILIPGIMEHRTCRGSLRGLNGGLPTS